MIENMNENLYMVHLGDEFALAEILEEVKDSIYFEIKSIIKNNVYFTPYLEDMIQECTISIIDAINGYREDVNCSFVTFMKKCIVNKTHSLIRYYQGNRVKANHVSISLDNYIREHENSYHYEMIEQKDVFSDPKFVFEYNEANHRFEEYFNSLSELDQQILMNYLTSESYVDAAKRFNMSVKAYDNRIQRIKRRLKLAIYSKVN